MFVKETVSRGGPEIVYLRSTLLESPHAFTTRAGGFSTLPHTSSLNLARHRGDPDDIVAKNIAYLARAVVRDATPVYADQVHGTDVVLVTERTVRAPRSCDALVSSTPGIAPLVKTADCVPILLECATGEVAAVHSGWRGTADDIAAAAVAFLASMGAKPSEMRAAVGPCIRKCCFEVGSEVAEAFERSAAAAHIGIAEMLRLISDIGGCKYKIDLQGCIVASLKASGLRAENIDVSDDCTCCGVGYYSHRRDKGIRGAQGAIIAPR
jgi:YfiH family protein